MAVVVVDEGGGVIVVFGGETEGVFGEEVAVGDAGGAGSAADGAKGGVIVMGGDAVLEGMVEDLGNILVAVVGVEKIEPPVLGAHGERARGDGFRGIPDEDRADGIRVGGVQPLDAKEIVVDEAEVRGNLPGARLLILHAAAKAVERHGNHGVALFQ